MPLAEGNTAQSGSKLESGLNGPWQLLFVPISTCVRSFAPEQRNATEQKIGPFGTPNRTAVRALGRARAWHQVRYNQLLNLKTYRWGMEGAEREIVPVAWAERVGGCRSAVHSPWKDPRRWTETLRSNGPCRSSHC